MRFATGLDADWVDFRRHTTYHGMRLETAAKIE